MSKNVLPQNAELHRGDSLVSNNKQWKAVFQDDGNFVIYSSKPTWASDTWHTDANRLCMQADCNLVMYNPSNVPRWCTGSYVKNNNSACQLELTDAGNLVVSRDGHQLWSSATSKGQK